MFVFLLLINLVFAQNLNSNFSLGTGLLSHSYNKNISLINTNNIYYLPIEARGYFNFNYFMFTPKWVITPIAKTSKDAAVKSYVSFLSLPFSFKWNDKLLLSLGLSMYWNILSGQGGQVIRNDGTETSTFARPNYTQTTQQLLLNIEAAFRFAPNYDVGFEIYSGQLFQNRQHFHFLLMFRKHFQLNLLGGVLK